MLFSEWHQLETMFLAARVLPCPVSERLAREGFYLPSGLALTDIEIATVIATVRDVLA
jgi:perosamine synthetase